MAMPRTNSNTGNNHQLDLLGQALRCAGVASHRRKFSYTRSL
jgi:hypothetical protein